MIKTIPLYYHPTQMLLIDDDQALTQAILLKLRANKIKVFNHPQEAQHYLSALPTHEDISVWMVDYHMPTMTGLELLAKFPQQQCKRILMTSEQDYKIGIDAFNQGLIHAYLRKDEAHFIDHLATLLQDMAWQYFIEKTLLQVSNLDQYKDFFSNESCYALFRALLVKHQVVSFAWQDKLGGFVLQDTSGKKHYLLVKSTEDLQTLALAAQEDGASDDVVGQICQAKAIPFFGEDVEFWQVKATNWKAHLIPVTQMCEPWHFFLSLISNH